MKLEVIFFEENTELLRIVSDEIEGEGSVAEEQISNAHRAAFEEFRARYPNISLFDGRITIGYDSAK